jgi:hypothetical protein
VGEPDKALDQLELLPKIPYYLSRLAQDRPDLRTDPGQPAVRTIACGRMTCASGRGTSEVEEARPGIRSIGKLRHLGEQGTADSSMQAGKLQRRVTRTRVNGCKLLEFRRLTRPLWIRRVLVRAQEGQ